MNTHNQRILFDGFSLTLVSQGGNIFSFNYDCLCTKTTSF